MGVGEGQEAKPYCRGGDGGGGGSPGAQGGSGSAGIGGIDGDLFVGSITPDQFDLISK